MTERPEYRLLGEAVEINLTEVPLPDFSNYEDEILEYWNALKRNFTKDPKLRVSSFRFNGDVLDVEVSRGIDFSHVLFSDMLWNKGLPRRLEDAHYQSHGKYYVKVPFSSTMSVAGLVVFDPNKSGDIEDLETKVLFGVRSLKTATDRGLLIMGVNGYVDIGPINEGLLKENLIREAGEEIYISPEEITSLTPIGAMQGKGRSFDLSHLVTTNLSVDEWRGRWIERKGQEESSGFCILPARKVDKIQSGKLSVIKGNGEISEVNVNRNLISALAPILTPEKIQEFLNRVY